jgi:hypothetical protein
MQQLKLNKVLPMLCSNSTTKLLAPPAQTNYTPSRSLDYEVPKRHTVDQLEINFEAIRIYENTFYSLFYPSHTTRKYFIHA